MPETHADCYVRELANRNLLDDAKSGTDKKGIHGGASDEESIEHFSYRFVVSCGRVEVTTLGPVAQLADISDALLTTFSDGHVTLLDIPCGAGPTALTTLATVAALREENAIPKLPLTITIVGGDYSRKSREIYESMLRRMQPSLSKVGITVSLYTTEWDATRGDSTASLVDQWLACSGGADEYVVCIANFSGALLDEGTFDQCEPSFEHILSRLHNRKSTLVWLEPSAKGTKAKVLPRILGFLAQRISWFRASSKPTSFIAADFKMVDPLNSKVFPTGVEIQRFYRR